MLNQQHHDKIIKTECKGFRLSPNQRHPNKLESQLTSSSCLSHGRMHLQGYPKVTLLGERLSHTPLHRGNRVPEFYNGFRQQLDYDKSIKATYFNPGDINSEEDDIDENEAICYELARHYAQHGLKDPEGYFDSGDKEVK